MNDMILNLPDFGIPSGDDDKSVVLGTEIQSHTEEEPFLGFDLERLERSDESPYRSLASDLLYSLPKEVKLSPEARWLGNYIVGIQGMGKSNLIKQIALKDIANREGVCVISPHPDLTQDILMRIPENRWEDVIVFDPSDDCPVGLNIFEWAGPESGIPIDKIADDVVTKTFQLIWADSWGPRMEEMMANVARTILYSQSLPPEKRPTLAEFEMIVGRGKDTSYRDFLMDHIQNTYKSRGIELLNRYWSWFDEQNKRDRETIASSTLNKARPFAANELIAHVVGQSVNKVDFREIMDDSKILLVDLNVDKLGTGNVELMGSLLVGRLFLAALSRETDPPPPRFHIIADEFGYFATPAFAALQDQARKFGVDVLVAHQRRGQLDAETRDATRSARNWVVFNVNPEDARELSEAFDSTPPPLGEPVIPMDRQLFIHASNPWDQLTNTGHDNQDIVELTHWIDKWLIPGAISDFTDWTLEEVYPKTSDGIKRIGVIAGWDFSGHTVYLWVEFNNFEDDQKRNEFIRNLNHILYKLMIGENQENCKQFIFSMCDNLYDCFIAQEKEYPWWDCPNSSIHLVKDISENFGLQPDGGEKMMRKVMEIFHAFYENDYETLEMMDLWPPSRGSKHRRSECLAKFAILYTKLYHRREMANKILALGKLINKFPVWVRGGQPTIEIKKPIPRPRTDVTLEWKNRFAHVPQYEAWCRIQEGREINEYHICTIEISPAPENGYKIAQQIREKSRSKYGVSRSEIENMMAARLDIGDDDDEVEEGEKL
jgi:hypothetical protein